MGRSSRLAIGAIAAAVAAGQVAPSHLGAAIALATRGDPARRARRDRRLGARCAAARRCRRRAHRHPPGGRAGRAAAARRAARRGRTVDARRRGHRARRATDSRWRRSRRRPDAAVRRSRSRRPCRAIRSSIPGDRVVVDGSDPATPRLALRRSTWSGSAPSARSSRGPLTSSRSPDDPGGGSRRCGAARATRSTRVLPEPEAGLAAGILIGLRDRGRSRPRRGVHDRRRQPRRRDLRLEHRDRRGGHRRADRPAGAPPPVGRDHRRDRRVRRVRGRRRHRSSAPR